MRAFLGKLFTTGVPVAVASGVLGYLVASFAGSYADGFAAQLRGNTETPSVRMKERIPPLMAGVSFAAVVVSEGASSLLRRNRVTPAATSTPTSPASSASGMDAEVEALLNKILAQTEAENLTQTPPPSAGTSGDAVGAPRNLSTTH